MARAAMQDRPGKRENLEHPENKGLLVPEVPKVSQERMNWWIMTVTSMKLCGGLLDSQE